MHHKRGRPKNRRAGCLFCKPHKANGVTKRPRNKRAQVAVSETPDAIAWEHAEFDVEAYLAEMDRKYGQPETPWDLWDYV